MSVALDNLASGDQSPTDFVHTLQAFAESSRAANHPLLQDLAKCEFRDTAGSLSRFLGEYYHYSHRFTRFLGAVSASLESAEHRAALVGNSAEEAGHVDARAATELRNAGIDPADAAHPHPELFRRFLRAIDVDPALALRRAPLLATSAWIETFHVICHHGGEAQAVGALGIATEGIVPRMYRYLLRSIHRTWPSMSKRDRVFFDLHAAVDDDHAVVLRDIGVALASTASGRRQLALGTLRALQARATFFDELHQHLRILDMSVQERVAQ